MCGWTQIIKDEVNKKIFWSFLCILILFVVDRLSKILSLKFLAEEDIFIIPDTTGFILERNQGIAYSIPLSGIYLIIILIIILIVLVYLAVRAYGQREIRVVISIGLIIAGAVSNLLDRLQYGYVVDMLVITRWPVFNIADLMILAGAVWLIIIYIKQNKS